MASRILSAPPALSVRRGPRRGISGPLFQPRPPQGPAGDLAASAGSSGARRVAGALSGERAVSLSRTPSEGGAGPGGRRGPGAERGGGAPGFRGLAREGERGRGGTSRPPSAYRAEAVWRRGRGKGARAPGQGLLCQLVPPARAPPGRLLPARSPARYVPVAPLTQAGEIETRKEKRRKGSQCAEPEPAGETDACCHPRVNQRRKDSRVRGPTPVALR